MVSARAAGGSPYVCCADAVVLEDGAGRRLPAGHWQGQAESELRGALLAAGQPVIKPGGGAD